jgi:hypothetical protein
MPKPWPWQRWVAMPRARRSMSAWSLAPMLRHAGQAAPTCWAARPARVVAGQQDPDPRTAGLGWRGCARPGLPPISSLPACAAALAGFLLRTTAGRPHVTPAGADARWRDRAGQWAKPLDHRGAGARHCHAERARADAILVGGGTLRADAPAGRAPARPGAAQPAALGADARPSAARLERGGRHCRAPSLRIGAVAVRGRRRARPPHS